ncbi:MAG TPA: hypothetical protein VJN95_00850 [Gemmatimonadales bacterium]|nr:hypothetical protein [Gemmatimonadales bacterium]
MKATPERVRVCHNFAIQKFGGRESLTAKGEKRKEKRERRKEKGERRKEKGERRKEKGERRKEN